MNTLLVGYDLDQPDQDYQDLFAALRSEASYWHHLDSTWLVVTSKTAKEMRDELKKRTGQSDKVLVIDVTGCDARSFGFSDESKTWIKDNVRNA